MGIIELRLCSTKDPDLLHYLPKASLNPLKRYHVYNQVYAVYSELRLPSVYFDARLQSAQIIRPQTAVKLFDKTE